MYERTTKHKHEICFARGIFNSQEKLAKVIDLWISQLKDANEIAGQFQELELYHDFTFKNATPDIEEAWAKVKNMHFNDIDYWKNHEWNTRYLTMLNNAKRHEAFKNLYPFTSHHALRFSKDQNIRQVWNLFLNIEPSWKTEDQSFKVSYNETAAKNFDDINEALNFLAHKMIEIGPLKLQD